MHDLYKILDDLGIVYQKYEHPPVFTVEDAEKYERGGGVSSKNIFLRNKKGDKHFLVILEAVKKINLKELSVDIQENGLSLASPERLMKYLGVTPGSVSPFGLINDTQKEVKVIVDEQLLKHDFQGFHPNQNSATLNISTNDLKKFLVWTGNQVSFLSLK